MNEYYATEECFMCHKKESTRGVRHPCDWFEISKFEIDGIEVNLTDPRFACSLDCLKDLIANLKYDVMKRIPK